MARDAGWRRASEQRLPDVDGGAPGGIGEHRVGGGDDEAERIAWLYRTLFGRPATSGEIALGREFVAAAAAAGSLNEAWREYSQALLTTNEFLFVD